MLAVQALVLLLAISWGGVRHIAWWNHCRLDLRVVLAGVSGAIAAAAGWRSPFSGGRQEMVELFGNFPIKLLFVLALLSGIAEEALFRGVLVPEAGILASSATFSLLHVGTPGAAAWSFLMGLVLAALYSFSGNLLLCMAFHAASNLASFFYLRGLR